MKGILGLMLAAALTLPGELSAERIVSLRGSPAAMQEQNRVAKELALPFYRTASQIRSAVAEGELVELVGNDDYEVASFVRYPYLRPELVLFVERLGAQYHAACGQKLVVTSGVRPSTEQPSNSHPLSVHPAGMAVDLRVSDRQACRSWIEDAFLNLEGMELINATREYNPPHYHVAVFPRQYGEYAHARMAEEAEARLAAAEVEARERLEAEALAFAATADDAGEGARDGSGAGGDPRILALAALIVALPVGVGYLVRRRD